MLQNSKFSLFDNSLKLKLENPEMGLDHWMSHIDQHRCSFRVEKVETKKKMMGGKRYGYKITTNDPLWNQCVPAVRSRSDFHLLQTQLEKRFPNAVVPRILKKEVDNLHMMELYLTELALNPFFRMDISFSDFLNGKQREYKQTKKNDRKHSQGTLRWLQQTTEYKEVEVSDDTIKSIKGDLDQLRRATNSLIAGLAIQIRTMTELQNCSGAVAGTLGDFLAVEQSSENKAHGSASGLPPGKVKSLVTKLINLHTNNQLGLSQSYDGGILERGTVHHLNIFVREIQGFRRVIDLVSTAKSEFDRAKNNFDSIPNENPNKDSVRQTLAQKEVIFFKQKRALMFELEKFRTFKTIKINTIFNNVCKFHLRGARRIQDEWGKSGVTLDAREEEQFLQKEQMYSNQETNLMGRNRSNTINRSTRKTKALDLKSLEVIQGYTPGMMSSRFLKVTKGELLTGYQLDNGDWQVTNNKTQKGVVKSAHVKIAEQQDGYRPAKPGPAPGLPPTLFNNSNTVDDDEWSFSDDGGGGPPNNFGAVNNGFAKPPAQPPSMPSAPTQPAFGLPPGLGNSSPPKDNNSGGGGFPGFGNQQPKAPVAAPAQQGFGLPPMATPAPGFGNPPPQGGNFTKPPQTSGGAFGMPGAQPTGGFNASGGFGMPGAQQSAPSFGGPKPPASKPFGGGGGPRPPASKPFGGAKPPKKAPKKNKFGGGGKKKPKLGGGMPGRPGPGGGMSFLADISKGNNMNKLKRVPDAEKSKEIGGGKGLSAADKAKGKKAPAMGGGGGLFGEMSAAFANRNRG